MPNIMQFQFQLQNTNEGVFDIDDYLLKRKNMVNKLAIIGEPMDEQRLVWNQGLVNLDFDDNKTRFRLNDYISSVIRQDNFQSGNHKDKSSQGEIMKKNTISKRSVFQDPSFIRSLCKVIGALRFSCITFFTYAPKSSKSYFVLNILKLDDFMFSTKTLCQMFFKLV